MSNTPQTFLSFTGVGLAALMLSRCAEDVLPSLKPKPRNDDELLQGTIDMFDKFEKASEEAMCNTPAYENAATLARWLRELKERREKDKPQAPVDPRIAEAQSVANGIAKLSEEQRKAQEMKPCGN